MANNQKHNEKATMLSRMGFKEKDIDNHTHDDLAVWLAQDKIQKIIIQKYVLKPNEKEILEGISWEITNVLEKDIKDLNNWKFSQKKEEEKEIIRHENHLIYQKIDNINKLEFKFKIIIKHHPGDWEHIVKTKRDFYLGYIDFQRQFFLSDNIKELVHFETSINYEIKVSQQPIGEILRQLNMYRENLIGQCFVVCQNDSWLLKYKEIIEDNGWKVITPKDVNNEVNLLKNIKKEEK